MLYANRSKIPVEPITSLLEEHIGNINSIDRWDHLNDSNWTYSIIPVKHGETVSFKCYGMFFMAFLTTYHEPTKGSKPDFCSTDTEHAGRFYYRAGVHKLIVPKGAQFLYFSRKVDGSDSTPRYLYIDYQNVLEGIVPDSLQSVFIDTPTDKQQVCVHHDSFCRKITGKPWHIGSNGGQYFPMEYESPRADYMYKDDGFRIQDNALVNDPNVSINEAFRFIDNKLNSEILIEIALPKELEVHERVVYNFKDTKNFESIQVRKEKQSYIFESIKRTNGLETIKELIKQGLSGNSIRLFASNKGICVYCDKDSLTFLDSKLNPDMKCGLMIDNQHTFKYDFFNCFQLQPYKIYDESIFTDNGIKQTHAGIKQGWVQDYSYTLDTIRAQRSHYAERFELRRNTITDYTNDRVEKSFNYQLQSNLRKIRIEFDVLIPEDYEKDESQDCLMQIHDRVDEDSLEVRSPYFAIRLQNNQFVLTAMSIEKHEKKGFNVNKILPIADCELGKWNHFSIYIKEGYLPEHNPITIIALNGNIIYESIDPNTNNNPRGGYIRYGLYKADWLKEKKGLIKKGKIGLIDKKVTYFDNFKITM